MSEAEKARGFLEEPSTDSPGAPDRGDQPDESSSSSSDSSSWNVKDRLFSTSPHESLESLDGLWQPEKGPRRLARGIRKMANVDGVTALEDVSIGLLESAWYGVQMALPQGQQADNNERGGTEEPEDEGPDASGPQVQAWGEDE